MVACGTGLPCLTPPHARVVPPAGPATTCGCSRRPSNPIHAAQRRARRAQPGPPQLQTYLRGPLLFLSRPSDSYPAPLSLNYKSNFYFQISIYFFFASRRGWWWSLSCGEGSSADPLKTNKRCSIRLPPRNASRKSDPRSLPNLLTTLKATPPPPSF